MHFLNVDHLRKPQTIVIIQASWHNNISTFKYIVVLLNKLRTNEKYFLQKHANNTHLHPKVIGFWKK